MARGRRPVSKQPSVAHGADAPELQITFAVQPGLSQLPAARPDHLFGSTILNPRRHRAPVVQWSDRIGQYQDPPHHPTQLRIPRPRGCHHPSLCSASGALDHNYLAGTTHEVSRIPLLSVRWRERCSSFQVLTRKDPHHHTACDELGRVEILTMCRLSRLCGRLDQPIDLGFAAS